MYNNTRTFWNSTRACVVIAFSSSSENSLVEGQDKEDSEDNEYGEGQGQLMLESVNNNLGQFVPDLLFEQLVKQFANTKKMLGDRLIRLLTGYDVDAVERNVRYPEFANELKKRIEQRIKNLENENFIDEEGTLTEKGLEKASIELLKSIEHRSVGEPSKKQGREGDALRFRPYKRGDAYRDIDLRASIKKAIRENVLDKEHLLVKHKQAKKGTMIVFALDASISMKGEKIGISKKAGVGLAYEAIQNKDKVGAVIFGTNIKSSLAPTLSFKDVLDSLVRARPSQQTDITKVIRHAATLFPSSTTKKHVVLITDALPTIGNAEEVVQEVARANKKGLTFTVIGIELDTAGRLLAERMVTIGGGRLYEVKHIKDIPTLVLQDYAYT